MFDLGVLDLWRDGVWMEDTAVFVFFSIWLSWFLRKPPNSLSSLVF
jgi:hypothetical protein